MSIQPTVYFEYTQQTVEKKRKRVKHDRNEQHLPSKRGYVFRDMNKR